MFTLPIKLAALGLVASVGATSLGTQAVAETQTASLSESQRRCLAEASRVKRDYIRHFGGDHVFYDFGYRSAEAKALCEHNDVDEAWDLMAEIKSDIRALRGEQREPFDD